MLGRLMSPRRQQGLEDGIQGMIHLGESPCDVGDGLREQIRQRFVI